MSGAGALCWLSGRQPLQMKRWGVFLGEHSLVDRLKA